MVQRVNFRPAHKYNTGGHDSKFIIHHIPGGKLACKRVDKKVRGPSAPKYLGHARLQGTKALRECGRFGAYKAPKRMKSVSRAYGGVLAASHVKDRIIRAFLVEEQKIVKKVMKGRRQ